MKFIIDIPDEHIEHMRTYLWYSGLADRRTSKLKLVREFFLVEDGYNGGGFDARPDVTIKKVPEV